MSVFKQINDWLIDVLTAVRSAIGKIMSSVCLSICLSITLTKRYMLQRKCLNKWIGSALLGTRFYNFQPPTPTPSPQTPHSPNFKIDTSGIISVAWMLTMAIPDNGLELYRTNCEEEDMSLRYVAYIMLTWRTCISRDIVYVILAPRISNAVRSAISATASIVVVVVIVAIILCWNSHFTEQSMGQNTDLQNKVIIGLPGI